MSNSVLAVESAAVALGAPRRPGRTARVGHRKPGVPVRIRRGRRKGIDRVRIGIWESIGIGVWESIGVGVREGIGVGVREWIGVGVRESIGVRRPRPGVAVRVRIGLEIVCVRGERIGVDVAHERVGDCAGESRPGRLEGVRLDLPRVGEGPPGTERLRAGGGAACARRASLRVTDTAAETQNGSKN